jgi:hypothetical protein
MGFDLASSLFDFSNANGDGPLPDVSAGRDQPSFTTDLRVDQGDEGSDAGGPLGPCVPGCDAGTQCASTLRKCVPVVVLTENVEDNFRLLAQANVDCWNYAGDHNNDNAICFVLDTTLATAPIDDAGYDDWVCSNAVASNFRGGDAELALAQDLSACGFDLDNTTFVVTPLPPGSNGEYCLAFDNTFANEVQLDDCGAFAGEPIASF